MIRKMLDISTAHLPFRFFDPADSSAWNNVPLHHETGYGVMVWVPDDPTDINNLGSEEGDDAVPPEIVALWRYARERGCDYIMLDEDGDVLNDLPTWEW
jgi:hypothetical protein